jgi:NAD(P)-dependent dehydrogenase (short-subunit alcohol dehydrogenase family)
MWKAVTETPLAGKTLVIVGGTTGIGLSAAKAFSRAGARLVVVGQEGPEAKPPVLGLEPHAPLVVGDAIDPSTAELAIQMAWEEFGSFHGLYHVAGGSGRRYGDGTLADITDSGWARTLELNLTSLFNSNRAAVRQFLQQKTGGTILNLGSVLAFSPAPRHFTTHAYAAAKSAIIGFSRSVAATYAKHNIRVNVLAPGLVDTPMSQRAVQDPSIQHYIQAKQPLDGGRPGQPSDLDAAAVYFMSEGSSFTTGQVLAVDGGWTVSEGLAEDPATKEASPTTDARDRNPST